MTDKVLLKIECAIVKNTKDEIQFVVPDLHKILMEGIIQDDE